jgi:hypothetical protein
MRSKELKSEFVHDVLEAMTLRKYYWLMIVNQLVEYNKIRLEYIRLKKILHVDGAEGSSDIFHSLSQMEVE